MVTKKPCPGFWREARPHDHLAQLLSFEGLASCSMSNHYSLPKDHSPKTCGMIHMAHLLLLRLVWFPLDRFFRGYFQVRESVCNMAMSVKMQYVVSQHNSSHTVPMLELSSGHNIRQERAPCYQDRPPLAP